MAQGPFGLGSLAPELFDKIFFELDTIRDLASFVVTARFVHHRFELQRRTILFRVLKKELGPAWTDARFLFVFPYCNPADEAPYYEWIYIMAAVYRGMLRAEGDPGPPPLKELIQLCRTLRWVNFITDVYATAQLGWFDSCGGGGTPATAPLSYHERHRIMRAFYLRQIVSNAWASTRRLARWTDRDVEAFGSPSGGLEQEGSLGLFSAFKPWDLQYVDHINVFMKRLCCALVCHAPEVGGEGAREILLPQFGDLYALLHHLVRYLRECPDVAKAAIGDIQSGIVHPRDESLYQGFVHRYQLLPLAENWQRQRAESNPDPTLNEQEQDSLETDYHVGDDPGQVPFGWSDALRGRYTSWYGSGLTSIPWLPPWETREKGWAHNDLVSHWRHCGFALWDRERVEALKRLEDFEDFQTGFLLDRS